MIYYISDTHFSHENIIKICNRPYSSVEEMNNDLIYKWNNKVKPDDIVYFLGDFAHKSSLDEAFNIMKQLNGKKYYIRGNHDKDNFLIRCKSAKLIESIDDYKVINDNNRMVVLFHYPIEDWDGQYHGSYHLFGHIHNNTHNFYRAFPKRFNVSVEVVGYEPRTLDELIELNTVGAE